MQIVIASGKGGTGKTTVATNIAYILSNDYQVTLADCDVEEPNVEIFFKCSQKISPVYTEVPDVIDDQCIHCGACGDFCRFGTLTVLKDRVMIFENLCHACGGCYRVCPSGALIKKKIQTGEIQVCKPENSLTLISGRLMEGDIRTTSVIHAVKQNLDPDQLVIIDAPPGTACPFIETVDKARLCVLVTEPTPFGLHDLSVAVDVLRVLNIPPIVVINRSDNSEEKIEEYCMKQQIQIIMRIPFDFTLLKTQNSGEIISRNDKAWRLLFSELAEKILEHARRF